MIPFVNHRTALALLFMSAAFFGIGVDEGADLGAAENRTGLNQTTADIGAIPEEITADFRRNLTGVEETFAVPIVRSSANAAVRPTVAGLRVGYHIPLAGRLLGPGITIAGLGLWVYSGYRRMLRGGEQ